MKTSPTHILAAVTASLAIAVCAEDITDNDYEDRHPQVSGNLIVWEAQVPDQTAEPSDTGDPNTEETPDDFEIMIRYGDENRRITDNDGDDINVKVSGSALVWQSWDGTDWEIWAYHAESHSMAQITDNDFDDINPAIDETRIVWQASDGDDFEIATASITALIPIEGSLRITPRSLNLRSNGGSVSATLSLAGTDVNIADIDPASILLQGTIPAENVRAFGNSIRMKFNRAALQALLTAPANVEIELTATSSDGSTVIATDTIRTIP